MNHLNEDKLIQYAFNLMDADEKTDAQQHLADCGDCRNTLDALKSKFSLMDTLTTEQVPTDELIARTIAHVKQQPETPSQGYDRVSAEAIDTPHDTKRYIPLYHRRWVQWASVAAAVVLVGFILLKDFPDTQPINTPPAKWEYPERGKGLLTSAQEKVRIVSADEIPDVPPFAPASAIELVVLPKPDKTQVTIYNSKDLTLVRDTRKLTLKPGWNWLQFMWANTQIDPTSLSLTPLSHADKVDIQLISYPARLKDIGRWLIRSEVEGAVPFEITYFASGLSWRAFYMGTMNADETTMDLKGYVNVSNNSGQDFLNAQTRLIVGETRLTEEIQYLAQRRYPYGPDIQIVDDEGGAIKLGAVRITNGAMRPDVLESNLMFGSGRMGGYGGGMGGDGSSYWYAKMPEIKEIEKAGLSEYFLYTIEGTEDLANQWSKRLPSFDVNDIPVKSLYKYDDDRYGTQPVRFVSFVNDTEHELGGTPIPEGNIKIYRNVNELQNLSYIGHSNIKYIPVNEDIELNLGPARLVKVEPVLVEQKTENYTFDPNNNITGWDDIETYTVTITNTRDIPIDIEITWNMDTDAWELDLNSSPPAKGEYPKGGRGYINPVYKKHDKARARFTMTVPEKSEETFGHTIRKYRQKRIEAYVQKMKEQQE